MLWLLVSTAVAILIPENGIAASHMRRDTLVALAMHAG